MDYKQKVNRLFNELDEITKLPFGEIPSDVKIHIFNAASELATACNNWDKYDLGIKSSEDRNKDNLDKIFNSKPINSSVDRDTLNKIHNDLSDILQYNGFFSNDITEDYQWNWKLPGNIRLRYACDGDIWYLFSPDDKLINFEGTTYDDWLSKKDKIETLLKKIGPAWKKSQLGEDWNRNNIESSRKLIKSSTYQFIAEFDGKYQPRIIDYMFKNGSPSWTDANEDYSNGKMFTEQELPKVAKQLERYYAENGGGASDIEIVRDNGDSVYLEEFLQEGSFDKAWEKAVAEDEAWEKEHFWDKD